MATLSLTIITCRLCACSLPCGTYKEASGMLDPREGHMADSQAGKIKAPTELMKTTVRAK